MKTTIYRVIRTAQRGRPQAERPDARFVSRRPVPAARLISIFGGGGPSQELFVKATARNVKPSTRNEK